MNKTYDDLYKVYTKDGLDDFALDLKVIEVDEQNKNELSSYALYALNRATSVEKDSKIFDEYIQLANSFKEKIFAIERKGSTATAEAPTQLNS